MTVETLGEHALLARVMARLPRPSPAVLVGPGDDAAILTVGRNTRLAVTTDAVVEEVHFSRTFSTPFDIGHRALAANLSDLAAMGAAPRWALLSLMLPGQMLVDDVESLVDGVAKLAAATGTAVAGGNITRSPGPLIVDVTAGGEVHPRRFLTRGGGRPGDELWVSGTLGGAAAGLAMLAARAGNREPGPPPLGESRAELRRGLAEAALEAAKAETGSRDPNPPPPGESQAELRRGLAEAALGAAKADGGIVPPISIGCIERYLRPTPRLRLGLAVARGRAARAAMDLSDGLADAVRQIAHASSCGAALDARSIPIDGDAGAWWTGRGQDALIEAIRGGDDYELVFAVPPRWGGRLRSARRGAADPLTRIGVLTKRVGAVVLMRQGKEEPMPQGFEHFQRG